MRKSRERAPSIKGTVFQAAPEDLRRLLRTGALPREQGFIELAASRIAGQPMRVQSEHPQADRIVFRGRTLR